MGSPCFMIRVRSKDKHKQPTDNYQCFLISCKSSGLFIHTHTHTHTHKEKGGGYSRSVQIAVKLKEMYYRNSVRAVHFSGSKNLDNRVFKPLMSFSNYQTIFMCQVTVIEGFAARRLQLHFRKLRENIKKAF
jgi:hypothetical protein